MMYQDFFNQIKLRKGSYEKAEQFIKRVISQHRYSAQISNGYLRNYNNQIANQLEKQLSNIKKETQYED